MSHTKQTTPTESKQTLSLEQKVALKHMLEVSHSLKHPAYPNSARGYEGMLIADKILKEKESVGVLIGGLAEDVWNLRRTTAELAEHKDVDVAVLNGDLIDYKPFEGGIDWWIHQFAKLNIKYPSGESFDVVKRWYKNGNGVMLNFHIEQRHPLQPGLYIPDYRWVVEMKSIEASSGVHYEGGDLEVIEKFRDTLGKRVKTRLPGFIRDQFKGSILSNTYEKDYRKFDALILSDLSLNVVAAINHLESQ